MIVSDRNLDIWYKDYLKKYKSTKKFILSKGVTPRNMPPETRYDFARDFESTHEDHPELSGKQIAELMAKQDLYPKSPLAAKTAAKAEADRKNIKMTPKLVLEFLLDENTDLWTDIANFKKNEIALAKQQNKILSSEDVALLVAQEFFGSL